MGRAENVQAWALVLGEPERASAIAEALRAAGFRTTVAVTVSEVRDLLAGGALPTLAIIDRRTSEPWRSDAVQRMANLVVAAAVRCMGIGGAPTDDPLDSARWLPATVTAADVVAAARTVHGHAPEAAAAEAPTRELASV